jgi:hypothetical protein
MSVPDCEGIPVEVQGQGKGLEGIIKRKEKGRGRFEMNMDKTERRGAAERVSGCETRKKAAQMTQKISDTI